MVVTNSSQMLCSQLHCSHNLLSPKFIVPSITQAQHSALSQPSPSPVLTLLHRPITLHSVSAVPSGNPELWLAEALDSMTTSTIEEGPVQLYSPSIPSFFATTDDPSPLQVATSVLLTGAISVFLFRSLRRRAKRAKEMQFRSSGVKKSLKEEALDSLRVLGSAPLDAKTPPSPAQAFVGGLTAGVIALILYKFTTTVEAGLSRQALSDNFSVRQITITIRTIVNGLCYLATFVFGINAVGLILYSGQLTLNSFVEGSEEIESKTTGKITSSNLADENSSGDNKVSSSKEEQSSNDTQ